MNDSPTVITSDIECARILTDEGLLDKLVPQEEANMAATFFERWEHYCMAVKHWGHADPTDNGFIIIMLPKSRFSRMDAARFFAEAINDTKDEWASIQHTDIPFAPLQNS